jgi:indole-3-glycerol phosphate synthase/phosphoribosylanthranilate isomerase
MSFLERIRPAKEAEVAALKQRFKARPAQRPDDMPVRNYRTALTGGISIIAEVKRKSPSNPALQRLGPVGSLARAYRRGGARALSLVTDAAHFGTSLDDVAALRAAVDLPILVKDFVIDTVQVQAAWAGGADAILLIARMLDPASLHKLHAEATAFGLSVLVECHAADEIEQALAAGAQLVGVNNRNLTTLTTDLSHGESLLPLVGRDVITVSESGLDGRDDVERMNRAGANAFLVGHALLLSADPGRKVAEMSGKEIEDSLRIKICGLTNAADARAASTAGAHLLGLVFAASPRQIDIEQAVEIRSAVPGARLCGVFQDAEPAEVILTAEKCGLDLIQLHGNESPQECRQLAESTGLPLIKALRPDEATPDKVAAYDAAAYLLIDRPKSGSAAIDQGALLETAARIKAAGREVFLAGGLDPANVADAVAACAPFGVDVSSGVESEPGRKDHAALREFIREASS